MTYPQTGTYWLEPTDRVAVGLRRYASRRESGAGWTCEDGYHSALVFTDQDEALFDHPGEHARRVLAVRPKASYDDPRWPTYCRCGYLFTPEDNWQDWQELLYRRTDTGQVVTLRETRAEAAGDAPPAAPPGATWDAWWMPESWAGPDGLHVMARCPNGRDWHVDGRASNCTMPDDTAHQCWVRHGDPRQANLTVDKRGHTCAAGAGSIQAGDYHGFLTGGVFSAG